MRGQSVGTLVVEQPPAFDEARARARAVPGSPSMQRPRRNGRPCARCSPGDGRRGGIASVVARLAWPVKIYRRHANTGGAQ